jgi:lipopolysaccharide/colanic/teichoic acid biosynthesis glycosyltransferase
VAERAIKGISSEADITKRDVELVLLEHAEAITLPVREPALKRAVDVTLSSLMLVTFAPIFGAIALAIRIQDRGAVLFRQRRFGRHGEEFTVLKFRTMLVDADSRGGLRAALEDDTRITRLGRFLRATGLDELPQLINIWRGDMSFVGPRALAVGEPVVLDSGEVTTYERLPGFDERLEARPGLTSPATIYLPKDARAGDKFRHDLDYIATLSVRNDLKLIALSIWISVRGKWETRQSKL